MEFKYVGYNLNNTLDDLNLISYIWNNALLNKLGYYFYQINSVLQLECQHTGQLDRKLIGSKKGNDIKCWEV